MRGRLARRSAVTPGNIATESSRVNLKRTAPEAPLVVQTALKPGFDARECSILRANMQSRFTEDQDR